MKRKAGTTLTLAAPLYVEGLPERHRQPAIVVFNGLFDAATTFNNERSDIAADGNLTPQGRAARAAKATAAALAQLTPVEAEIKKLSETYAAIEKALLAKVVAAAPKDAATELQMREIRDQLRQLPASERLAIYRTPTTPPLVLAAIETAPMTLSVPSQGGSQRFEPFVDPTELAADADGPRRGRGPGGSDDPA